MNNSLRFIPYKINNKEKTLQVMLPKKWSPKVGKIASWAILAIRDNNYVKKVCLKVNGQLTSKGNDIW